MAAKEIEETWPEKGKSETGTGSEESARKWINGQWKQTNNTRKIKKERQERRGQKERKKEGDERRGVKERKQEKEETNDERRERKK
jgi:hypothetical protein